MPGESDKLPAGDTTGDAAAQAQREIALKGRGAAVSNLIGRVVWTGAAVLTTYYVVNRLSKEAYGSFGIITQIVFWSAVICSLGLGEVMHRYLPDFRVRGDQRRSHLLVLAGVVTRGATAIVFCLALWLARGFIARALHFPDVLLTAMPLVYLLIPMVLEAQLLGDGVLVALIDHKFWNLARSLYAALKFGLFAWSLHAGGGLKGIVTMWLILEACLLAVYALRAFALLRRREAGQQEIETQPPGSRRISRYAVWNSFIAVVHGTEGIGVDCFVIAYVLKNAGSVGIYYFASKLAEYLAQISPSTILRNVVMPLEARRYAADDRPEAVAGQFRTYMRFILLVSAPMFVGAILIVDLVVAEFFDGYLSAIPVARVALFFALMGTLRMPYIILFNTLERPQISLYGRLIFFGAYNVAMDLILVPRMGIIGAAWATGTAKLFFLGFLGFVAASSTPARFPWAACARTALNVALMCAVVLGLRRFVSGLAALVVCIPAGFLTYAGATAVNMPLDQPELHVVKDWLISKRGRPPGAGND